MKKSLIQRTPDGKYKMLVIRSFHWVLPSPYRPQNIEKKETGKNLPRKILHPKELDAKSSIERTYRPNATVLTEPQTHALPGLTTGHWLLTTAFQRASFARTLSAARAETQQPCPRPS